MTVSQCTDQGEVFGELNQKYSLVAAFWSLQGDLGE